MVLQFAQVLGPVGLHRCCFHRTDIHIVCSACNQHQLCSFWTSGSSSLFRPASGLQQRPKSAASAHHDHPLEKAQAACHASCHHHAADHAAQEEQQVDRDHGEGKEEQSGAEADLEEEEEEVDEATLEARAAADAAAQAILLQEAAEKEAAAERAARASAKRAKKKKVNCLAERPVVHSHTLNYAMMCASIGAAVFEGSYGIKLHQQSGLYMVLLEQAYSQYRCQLPFEY